MEADVGEKNAIQEFLVKDSRCMDTTSVYENRWSVNEVENIFSDNIQRTK